LARQATGLFLSHVRQLWQLSRDGCGLCVGAAVFDDYFAKKARDCSLCKFSLSCLINSLLIEPVTG
jgi:hypothetical protein